MLRAAIPLHVHEFTGPRRNASRLKRPTHSHQRRLAFINPVHRHIQVLQVSQSRSAESGRHSAAIKTGQARQIDEPARKLDGVKLGRVGLYHKAPGLGDVQVSRQQAGFINLQQIPGGFLAERANFQLRNHHVAQLATIPLGGGNHPPTAEDIIPKIFPEAGREAGSHIEQRERAFRMRKAMVRKVAELNSGRTRPMNPKPVALGLAGGRNRPLIKISSRQVERS